MRDRDGRFRALGGKVAARQGGDRRRRAKPYVGRAADLEAARVLEAVAAARSVSASEMLSSDRCRDDVVLARRLAMYLMHVALGRRMSDVAVFFGRNQSTVSHAVEAIEEARERAVFDEAVAAIERTISGMDGEQRDAAA